MIALIVVAIAALVIGAAASGLITHSLTKARADFQLGIAHLQTDAASSLHYVHARIDALEASVSSALTAAAPSAAEPPAPQPPAEAPEAAPAVPQPESPESAPEAALAAPEAVSDAEACPTCGAVHG